jgi:Fe2+ or Zn2+ uptake regulation protein
MACLRCGKIQEFESDLFDRLKGQVQRECRFHIVVSRFEIGGYCANCRSSEGDAARRPHSSSSRGRSR